MLKTIVLPLIKAVTSSPQPHASNTVLEAWEKRRGKRTKRPAPIIEDCYSPSFELEPPERQSIEA